ncbi:MAG: cytochrome-c oxidase, cbb3-type subunit III [Alphaproteobacteria bacterium]|nr:cytochrome-c oxidase, cbb3-type subunit III [Alphaproteobacteria bacterium]
MPTKIEKDAVTGTDTTGHEWDGIKELNTPLPKWWLYILYATVIWGVGYMIAYPAWPGLRSHTDGLLGYNSRADLAETMAMHEKRRAPRLDRIRAASLEDIRGNADLLRFAIAGGRVAFAENCAGCHGAGGAGAKGFPNLADDDWLWGGTLAEIQATIQHGVRTGDDKARASQMPRFGADGLLKPGEIADLAEYVLALSGQAHDADAAKRAQGGYADQCASCHGDKGQGNREVGAPRLDDRIWLYGGDRAAIARSIAEARGGVMPGWTERLDAATLKMLAVYVHALGGGL